MDQTTPSNSFIKTLTELRKGQSASELSEALTELVAACKRVGRKGEMTLKIRLTPSSDGETILIQDDFTVKTPKMERKHTTFFSTEDNQLRRDNPKQITFYPKVVPGSQAESTAQNVAAAK